MVQYDLFAKRVELTADDTKAGPKPATASLQQTPDQRARQLAKAMM